MPVGCLYREEQKMLKRDYDGSGRTILILKIVVAVLAVLSLALLIALIVVVSKDHKPEALENGSSSSSSVKDFCPEETQLESQPARSAGLYDDLSKDEIIAVRDYILSQSSLNVTAYEDAAINDNYIYLIELQQPLKDDALAFLDNDAAPKPERTARVIVYHGGEAIPVVKEYLVSPAGNPTTHKRSPGPGHKDPIPFNTRFADPKEVAIMDKMLMNLTKYAYRLLNESYGYTFYNCKERCMRWGLSAPSTNKPNERKRWTWFMRDMIGFYIHPVGFEVLLNTGGNDVSRWTVEKIYYNNATYDSVEELMRAYDGGSKTVFKAPEDGGLFSTYQRRGDPQPKKPLRNPQLFEPDGKRYTVSGHHVEYMGWSFDFRSRTSSGIQIFDIKFNNERVVYELSVQEALAFYSGWSPKPMTTNYLDAAWNMGSMTFELLRGVDCPNTATFFDAIHFVGRSNPAKYRNTMCLFEQDMGIPLRRHYDTNFNGGYNFYGGMPGSALILRAIATTYNYDYVFDYIFYPNGVVEVRSATSGFPQATFWTIDEDPYANQIHTKLAGSLHDHIFSFKVDMDILGRKNSYETIHVGIENITNPWYPDEFHVQKVLHRRLQKNETEAVYHYNFDHPTYLNFFNKDKMNDYGNHRGYRIQIRDAMKQMYPETWPVVRGAAWSLNQMTVTQFKETEEQSSSIYNQQDMVDPVVDFSKYIDGENIENEDLVAWVSMGLMHIPHSEDVPNTATPGTTASFFLRPFNFFKEDPSMASYDGVLIKPSDSGAQIDAFGTPTGPACAPKNMTYEFSGLYGDF